MMSLLRFCAWEHLSCIAFYGGSESSRISSKISLSFILTNPLRLTKVLQVWNELRVRKQRMTGFSFLGDPSF